MGQQKEKQSITVQSITVLSKVMPGLKLHLQEGGEVRDELTCSYCKLVLRDPVQTSESGLRFCKECFSKAQALVISVINNSCLMSLFVQYGWYVVVY